MGNTRHAYASFDVGNRTYIVPTLGELDVEEAAELQGATVEHHHGRQAADVAFRQAVEQLSTRDYEREWWQLEQAIRARKMWGGPVPRAVIIPDQLDPKEAVMILVTPEGTAQRFKVRLPTAELMEVPNSENSYYKDGTWYAKPPAKTVQRRRLERHLGR